MWYFRSLSSCFASFSCRSAHSDFPSEIKKQPHKIHSLPDLVNKKCTVGFPLRAHDRHHSGFPNFMPPLSCYRTEEAPHRTIIIPHIMHMAHIIFFMGFSFLRQRRFFFSADSIHPKEDFVNPFLQFSKKKNSFRKIYCNLRLFLLYC